MPNNILHFAIQADDVPRARKFYEKVFGWRFEPWGPPNFYMVTTGTDDDPGIVGSLEERGDPLTGTGHRSCVCTISVDSVDATAKAITRHGGKVLASRLTIPTVGVLCQFEDTEQNVLGAMQYEPKHLRTMLRYRKA